MKIILATHHFPPHYIGGAEQYAFRLSKELSNRGHLVEVICIESISKGGIEPSVEYDTFDGIKTLRLSFDFHQYDDPFTASYRNDHLGKWFYDYLHKNRPDILHINAGYLLSFKVPDIAHQLGIPAFITIHDYWYMCPKIILVRSNGETCQGPVPESMCNWCLLSAKRRYRLMDRLTGNVAGEVFTFLAQIPIIAKLLGLETFNRKITSRREYIKEILKNIDVLISPSQFALQKFDQYGLQARARIYLPAGYRKPPEIFPAKEERSEKVRFGYLGQIAPHKGIHTLVKAFRQVDFLHQHAELYIFGKVENAGRYSQELQRLAGGSKSILFTGPYDNQQIDQVMQKIDFLVVPSEWFENRPTVIFEAFSYKKPVIASKLGGIPELVTHGKNGLLFRPGDSHDLADQLSRIVREPSLRDTLRNGIEPVKTIAQEVDELEILYRKYSRN